MVPLLIRRESSFFCNTRIDFLWQRSMACTTTFSALPTTTVITIITSGEIASTTTSWFTVGGYNAYGIQVRFQETDFQSTTTTSVSSAGHQLRNIYLQSLRPTHPRLLSPHHLPLPPQPKTACLRAIPPQRPQLRSPPVPEDSVPARQWASGSVQLRELRY